MKTIDPIIGAWAIAALIGVLLSGCATSDPKPATGVMLDPVWHTEVHDVTVDTE
jgi:hypothetical protein